jgi:hypothetical protein
MPIECRHCEGKGTCTTGENGNSCDACVEKAKESVFPFVKRKIESKKGLPCGSCQGFGDVEGRVWQMQGRGRERPCGRPPAQIRTCGITAYGSYLRSWRWHGEPGHRAR